MSLVGVFCHIFYTSERTKHYLGRMALRDDVEGLLYILEYDLAALFESGDLDFDDLAN